MSVGHGTDLREGRHQSCGCLRDEVAAVKSLTHGHARGRRTVCPPTPEYQTWLNVKARCGNPKNPRYADYGGRGILLFSPWQEDFAAFLAAVGPKPSPRHSIDRIDNDKGYEPGNVRWATPEEQSGNRRPGHTWRRKAA